MEEKALIGFLAKIIANQQAIIEMITLLVGTDESKKELREQFLAHYLKRSEDYLKVVLPQMLKASNLDWNPADLFDYLKKMNS